jgi:hypothetical protein
VKIEKRENGKEKRKKEIGKEEKRIQRSTNAANGKYRRLLYKGSKLWLWSGKGGWALSLSQTRRNSFWIKLLGFL